MTRYGMPQDAIPRHSRDRGWRGKPRETLIRTEQGREIDTVLQHGFTLVTVASDLDIATGV